ncbi:gastric triacylglycerol lipase-like [Amblyomma americanum]
MLPRDADADRDIVQLIEARGYPVETHQVVAADGYVLTMNRIPGGRSSIGDTAAQECDGSRKPAVLAMHGLLGSAVNWVGNFADQSLGFVLADAGYDVWLGNLRGCTLSRGHLNLSADKDARFWDFSFQEMIEYDLPAMIDHVLEETGLSRIGYVGHSQGTLVMFGLLSSAPEYNDKVALFVALAPVTAPANVILYGKEQLLALSQKPELRKMLLKMGEFGEQGPLWQRLGDGLCRSEETVSFCYAISNASFGPSAMANLSRFHVYLHQIPAGTSWKNLLHFAQIVRTGKFCKYNYGAYKNKKRYGQALPPCYTLEKIRAPVAIFWGHGDTMSTPRDIDQIRTRLSSTVVDERVGSGPFAHLDFIYGFDARSVLHDRVVQLFRQYYDSC